MKTFRSRVSPAALALALALVLVACSDPPPPAARARPATAATTVAPATPTAEAAKAAVAEYVYTYAPMGKRDPFRSPEESVPGRRPPEPSRCGEPLCQWDLDQLNLVAIVSGDASPVAMVEDPVGRGHIVRRGTKMGRHGGKVTQILRDSLTVTEYLPGGADGKVVSNPVSLQLRPDDARAPVYNLMTGRNWE